LEAKKNRVQSLLIFYFIFFGDLIIINLDYFKLFCVEFVKKMNKPNDHKQLCSYIHRICLQNKLDGFDYCIRHILVDKGAPFKQCSFIHPISSKRCPNAARKTERRDSTLCPWHIKKLYLKYKQTQLQQQMVSHLFQRLD